MYLRKDFKINQIDYLFSHMRMIFLPKEIKIYDNELLFFTHAGTEKVSFS